MFCIRNGFKLLNAIQSTPLSVWQARGIKRWVAPTLKELKNRREKMGPEPLRPRSSFLEWNYGAELFAFGKRLNEEFDRDLLQQAFTHRSYVIQEEKRLKDVGIEALDLEMKDNRDFIAEGDQLISNYIKVFLYYSFPKMPEIGVNAIHDYLMSEEILAHVSSHLGTKDIILCSELPVQDSTLASTFKAIVSVLSKTKGDDRAFLFVRDFLLTQLNQKDLHEIWIIERPMELLKEICNGQKLEEPEPRLIGESGKNTILACTRVGIYCNKQLVSTGFGENAENAIHVAALNALSKLFRIEESSKPLNFRVTLNEMLDAINKQKASRI